MRERRDQLVHPAYTKRELLATGPNQLWSWDITKLLGPTKWTYFYLYVILDVFSRYVVGWMVADGESSELAKRLIADTCAKQADPTGHADDPCGPGFINDLQAGCVPDGGFGDHQNSQPPACLRRQPVFGKPLPDSEIYRPGFPEHFGSLQDARSFSQEFFAWYNDEHRHSWLGLLSPTVVHHGLAQEAIERRRAVLDAAYRVHPDCFVRKPPQPLPAPQEVWINKPKETPENKAQ